MQFMPGHFCCDVVWSTVIHVHPRLKMGPSMGVSKGEEEEEEEIEGIERGEERGEER